MSSIVADGTLELQDRSLGYVFEVVDGGLDDIPAVRGGNVMIPQKAGLTWMPKVENHMLVTLHGTVYGDPSMGVTARESYRSRMAALHRDLQPDGHPVRDRAAPRRLRHRRRGERRRHGHHHGRGAARDRAAGAR